MSHTAERIEMVKLLQTLREGDEKPGPIVLRALRALVEIRDVAKNGTRNTAAWQEIIEIADRAIGNT